MAIDTNPISRLSTVLIVGPGLLGGSVGLGLKAAGFTGKVIGDARNQATLDMAIKVGCIDQGATDLISVAGQADLILIATPLKTFRHVMQLMRDHLKPGAIITDVGSTKCSVINDAKAIFTAEQLKHFVPSHPMAGSQSQGPEGASAQMLKDRPCIVTPIPGNDPDDVTLVKNLWELLGMQVIEMTPQQHDEQSAVISHLPHLLNVLQVQTAVQMGGLEMASTGFQGATRLASSNPTIRADILECNRDAILTVIQGFETQLNQIKQQIKAGDRKGLLEALEQAKNTRDQWATDFEHRG
ncbi:MAG: prephenate dehydrogenase, partial [Phycisphaeraceae bacterium]|nr:prephenate dehydrogenase [Phycisphaeraceae bacterium]